MGPTIGVTLAVVVVLAIAAGIRHAVVQARQRTAALAALASKMRFRFSKEGDAELPNTLGHFHLFSQGHSKKITNVLRGRANDMDVLIFDYRYTTGGGQHSNTSHQTVILFESDGMQLPQFALRPENVFHKIGQVFGYQDIDFDSHPEFSKRYLLKGEDEGAVRDLFTRDVLSFYEADGKLSSEAAGGRLIHYRHGKRSRPEQIQDFITEGVRVLTLLRA